jgi:two-component system, sensor histidine kinase and response regulator
MKASQEVLEQLLANEPDAFLAAIVESSDDAIFGMGLDGTIVTWNEAAARMYGYRAAEIIGRPVLLLEPPERVGEMRSNLDKFARGEAVPHFETVRLTKSQKLIDVSVTTSPVRSDAGEIVGIAVIARDITQRKKAQAALLTANRVKTQFLNNINHEIRTPMNGILGMTELVLDTELTTEQRENLGLVKISAESLLAAIDDILDYSQIDAGKLQLEPIFFDLRESLAETMKMLGFRAQKKALELIYEVQPEIPDVLFGDPGRIRRILINLVGNSIKFTDRGEIVVTVRPEAEASPLVTLHFEVKDTGIGISPDQEKLIFEPFSQADGSLTRKRGGTGLGLTIARKLVEIMQGRIWLESEIGKGATFHFTAKLEIQKTPAPHPQPLDLGKLKDVPSLIVDDNSVSRRVLRGMLCRWGMRATDVAGGHAALEALRIAKDMGYPFQLVLLDSQMTDIDGFSVAERIKEEPSLAGSTVMMLTSVGHVGDAARCRNFGIGAYLVKPVHLSELANAICLALERANENPTPDLVTRHTLRESRNRLIPAT